MEIRIEFSPDFVHWRMNSRWRCSYRSRGISHGTQFAAASERIWHSSTRHSRPHSDDAPSIALGVANGDLFTHVLAFSPGFLIPLRRVGAARYFLSHGTRDDILPIDHTRAIVGELRRAHLDVHLREFDGGHTVPPEIAREAFAWFVK
jgi:hypothetical protein